MHNAQYFGPSAIEVNAASFPLHRSDLTQNLLCLDRIIAD